MSRSSQSRSRPCLLKPAGNAGSEALHAHSDAQGHCGTRVPEYEGLSLMPKVLTTAVQTEPGTFRRDRAIPICLYKEFGRIGSLDNALAGGAGTAIAQNTGLGSSAAQ